MKRASVVDAQKLINEHPFGRFQRLIFFMCFVIVMLDGFDTAAIGFIAPSLLTEWHLSRPDLVPVLSAALFGLAFGALVSGPLSDRIGRRSLMVGSVLLFGVACVMSAFSTSIGQLTVLRFMTGIGLGAAMPGAVTMMDEFCPTRRRATVTSLMCCGFPLGAALGGLLAAWLIPHAGWRSVLIVGGIAPILHTALLLLRMPESVRFMIANGKPVARIRAILARISEEAGNAHRFVLTENAPETGDKGLGLVLSRPYIVGTLMLWLAAFTGLLIIYALINWMPILLRDAGLSQKSATLISALFPLGGVGAVLCGALMDRFNANLVIATCYALAAVSLFCIGATAAHVGLLVPIVVVSGVLTNTAQASMNALAAAFYPTEGRGTGVAWMLGIARFGGIAGSFLVAELVRWHFTFVGVFATIAVAGALSCIALLVKQFASSRVTASYAITI
ncbi:MFS transporter [Paraburkholderia susongensis]|uniref:MFS transporter, AAHS family, 4-hydroxybenzoate transporter n=1 Tax=Paraburkholderia susongensis TaxID=1515439 RepID=A0A1X7J7U9_9BURK|nr:aromatic acid/H+ symport family MFS transporter [Paraburkholderia susongensis]SMG23763.1 MFS transporter, AAHS family, 4-hydroxybenzoate transporter [Paraburkholderia susongensis]